VHAVLAELPHRRVAASYSGFIASARAKMYSSVLA
jgi:hypothetical protein